MTSISIIKIDEFKITQQILNIQIENDKSSQFDTIHLSNHVKYFFFDSLRPHTFESFH